MSCELTSGRSRTCKSLQGGIKKVYLFPFVKYSRSQIVVDGLTLEEFPATTIYEFEVVPSASFDQRMTDDAGGKYYDQSITLQFLRIEDTIQLQKFLKKDYRMIIEDNNGNLRMLGAYNGLVAESLDSVTGGAKTDFNGITISFTGMEKTEALFIDDLADSGFVFPSEDINYIFIDSNNFIFMDSNNFIFN